MKKMDLFIFNNRLPFMAALFCVFSIISVVAQKNPYQQNVYTGNPIVPNIGLDDGHMHVFGDRIYDYACHDYSPDSKDYVLKMWWVWSSADLQTWTCESSVSPAILGFPEGFKDCWATDALARNGKYYWYLCNPLNTYVIVSDTPIGPWKSPLGNKPLMEGRDPAAFIDNDGKAYLVTGVWTYRIAKMGDDMISLAEEPKTIKIINPHGPYNADGKNTQQPTDDKPFLHKHNGKYYLSWGCYYAMADNVYGPYTYTGCFIVEDRTEQEFRQAEAGLTYDRHGSFFEFNNQTYFNCNDLSSNGANTFWRNTIIMYIHYRDNGEIEPAYINKIGVGQYSASAGRIEAENYFSAVAAEKCQNKENGFEMRVTGNASSLVYSNVMNLSQNCEVTFQVSSENPGGCVIEVWNDRDDSELLGTCVVPETGGKYKTVKCTLKNKAEIQNIRLTFKGTGSELLRLDWMSFR
jgi:arabinoxylan arabinofuranohydrolase